MNDSNQIWYVQREGKTSGPYALEKLQQWAEAGHLTKDDLLRRNDSTDWRPAHHQLVFIEPRTTETPPNISINPVVLKDKPKAKTKREPKKFPRNKRLWVLAGTLGVLLIVALIVFTGSETENATRTDTNWKDVQFGQQASNLEVNSNLQVREFRQFDIPTNNDRSNLDVEASEFYELGAYPTAIELYSQIIENNPNDLALLRRGMCYYRLKNYKEAVSDFAQTNQLNQDPEACFAYAFSCYQLGEFNQAITNYSLVIELQPENALAYNYRGLAHLEKDDQEEAISDYKKAIELNESYVFAYTNLRDAHLLAKDYINSIKASTELLKRFPNDYMGYYLRGIAYHYEKDYEAAKADYTQAISLFPNDASFFVNRAIVQRNLGETKLSNDDIKRARELGYDGELTEIPIVNDTSQTTAVAPQSTPTANLDNMPDLAKELERGVVTVRTDVATGTGFLIDGNGTITTNHHVVEGATEIMVTFSNGLSVEVDGMLGVFPGYDTAFLKITLPESSYPKPLSLVDSNHVIEKAQEFFVIGAPKGNDFSFVKGTVVQTRNGPDTLRAWKNIARGPLGLKYDPACSWIEHDTRVDSGNSGSPLMDAKGNVLGMHTLAVYSKKLPYNFAVDGRVFKELLAKAGDTVKLISQIPKIESPVVTLPKTVAVKGFNNKFSITGSVEEFKRLYKRRSELLEYEYEVNEYIDEQKYLLQQNTALFNKNLSAYQQNARSIQNYNNLIQSTTSSILQSSYRSSINSLQSTNAIIDGYQTDIRIANQKITNNITKSNAELAKTSKALLGVRKDWLRLVDPFGTFNQGDITIAYNEFNEWVRLDSKFYLAYLGRGMVNGHMKNFANAHSDLKQATNLLAKANREELAEVPSSHAMVCIMEQDIREAMKYANLAIKADSDQALPHAVKAVGFFNFGNFSDAQTSFNRAIAANAGNDNLYLHINYAAFLSMCPDPEYRDPEKALEHASKAYRLGGGVNADCAFILAAAYAENNDAKNAVKFCNIAITQQPDAKTQNEWEQIKVLFNVNKKVRYTPAALVEDS